ncbi:MAG: MATE family efflux transporter [Clostridia bacterium]|nr:MATE family efflux transporter [Clostridia bacterium]
MLSAPLWPSLIKYIVPLLLTGLLQLFYNAADIAVVGRFSGPEGAQAMAAVGSTSSLIHLIVNVFLGLSAGTNVVAARALGAKDKKTVSETAHTAIAAGFIFGLGMTLVGLFFSDTFLSWMGTPNDVRPAAALYMQIYFAGVPFSLVYNFAAALLRAAGDTKKPLYFLTLSGAANVVLNLLFVIVCKWSVAGVALATSLSQGLAMALVLRSLKNAPDGLALNLRRIRLYKGPFREILKIGLPAGAQSALFSLANVVIQSAINSFQSIVMAGNAAAVNLESFVYTATNAVYQANLTFTSQNVGARNVKRVKAVYWHCMALTTLISAILGGVLTFGGEFLLSLYNADPAVIEAGMIRLCAIAFAYCACGWMDVTVGQLRGIGYSFVPMVLTLLGSCGLRILWVYTVFAATPTLQVLYGCFPVSWVVTFICQIVYYYLMREKKLRLLEA